MVPSSFAVHCSVQYHEHMTNATIQNRLIKLEVEMKMLKSTMPRPDLSVDEKNWGKVKSTVNKVRGKLSRERYA